MLVTLDETSNILDNSIYLDRNLNSVALIPVVENSRLGCNIVAYDKLAELQEEYNLDIDDAISVVMESNNLDNLAVSVPEGLVMLYPEIVNECDVVIEEASPNSYSSILLEESLDYWLETGDDSPLYNYIHEVLDNVSKSTLGRTAKSLHVKNRRRALQKLRDIEKRSGTKFSKTTRNAFIREYGDGDNLRMLINANKRLSDIERNNKWYNKLKRGASEKFNSGKNWVKSNKLKAGLGAAGSAALSAGGAAIAANGGVGGLVQRLSALKARLRGAESQYNMAPPEQKGMIRTIIDKIKSMISTIVNKIKELSHKKIDISTRGVRYVD